MQRSVKSTKPAAVAAAQRVSGPGHQKPTGAVLVSALRPRDEVDAERKSALLKVSGPSHQKLAGAAPVSTLLTPTPSRDEDERSTSAGSSVDELSSSEEATATAAVAKPEVQDAAAEKKAAEVGGAGLLAWASTLLGCARRSAPTKPAVPTPAPTATPAPRTASAGGSTKPKVIRKPLPPPRAGCGERTPWVPPSAAARRPSRPSAAPAAWPAAAPRAPLPAAAAPKLAHLPLPVGFQPPPGLAAPPGLLPPPGLEQYVVQTKARPAEIYFGAALTPASFFPSPAAVAAAAGATPSTSASTSVDALPPAVDEVVPEAVFCPRAFRRELVSLLHDLSYDRNTGKAVQRVRAQQVPVENQAGEFVDVLTRAVETKNGMIRRSMIAFAAGLAAGTPSAFDHAQCEKGTRLFFKEVYPSLREEVPTLPTIASAELLPTLRLVLPPGSIDDINLKAL